MLASVHSSADTKSTRGVMQGIVLIVAFMAAMHAVFSGFAIP
jgi:hypothetical protein